MRLRVASALGMTNDAAPLSADCPSFDYQPDIFDTTLEDLLDNDLRELQSDLFAQDFLNAVTAGDFDLKGLLLPNELDAASMMFPDVPCHMLHARHSALHCEPATVPASGAQAQGMSELARIVERTDIFGSDRSESTDQVDGSLLPASQVPDVNTGSLVELSSPCMDAFLANARRTAQAQKEDGAQQNVIASGDGWCAYVPTEADAAVEPDLWINLDDSFAVDLDLKCGALGCADTNGGEAAQWAQQQIDTFFATLQSDQTTSLPQLPPVASYAQPGTLNNPCAMQLDAVPALAENLSWLQPTARRSQSRKTTTQSMALARCRSLCKRAGKQPRLTHAVSQSVWEFQQNVCKSEEPAMSCDGSDDFDMGFDDESGDPSHLVADSTGSVSLDTLRKVFDLPISSAARKLGMGVTVLKKHCRDFRIKRWPYRKLRSLSKLISAMEALVASDYTGATVECVTDLKRQQAAILADPSKDLEPRTKKLRQVNFKHEFKQRKGKST